MTMEKERSQVSLRALGAEDIEEALAWRMEVLSDVFAEDAPWDFEALREENRRFLERHLGTELVCCIASVDGIDAGCGAFCLQEELPSPDNPSARCAYLMNIYTRKRFRGHGVGRHVVAWLMEAAHDLGCGKVYLEATEAGRPLYASMGFKTLDGMMKLET